MLKYTIMDLDNCISNDAHRIPLIESENDNLDERWEKYHQACGQDALANKHLIPDEGLIILTARPSKFYTQTIAWLKSHNIDPVILIMRNAGDYRMSHLVKEQQLVWLAGHYEIDLADIMMAFDDHIEIVEMYRAMGLPAQVLKAHNTPYTTHAVARILSSAAKTFAERNALYGNNYKEFGEEARKMFPTGLAVHTEEEWNRLGVFTMCLGKLTRYAASMHTGGGGHKDSAHDLVVYAAMLEELTK